MTLCAAKVKARRVKAHRFWLKIRVCLAGKLAKLPPSAPNRNEHLRLFDLFRSAICWGADLLLAATAALGNQLIPI